MTFQIHGKCTFNKIQVRLQKFRIRRALAPKCCLILFIFNQRFIKACQLNYGYNFYTYSFREMEHLFNCTGTI
jgi:hypothetical protein